MRVNVGEYESLRRCVCVWVWVGEWADKWVLVWVWHMCLRV